MAVPSHELEERTTVTVLVTGANSGLGFALCCRLINEFLLTRPQSQTLHLLFSTRDVKKSEDTLRRLNAHLRKTLRAANGRTTGDSLFLEGRIKLEGVLLDLTKLLTVKAMAKQLLARGQHLDAVVWNAGVAGWAGYNWPKMMWHMLTDLIDATTYPTYANHIIGMAAEQQVQKSPSAQASGVEDEPVLGQVFLANVFGHYLLTHWLSPLLSSDSRIVWISSLNAFAEAFEVHDMQGLDSAQPYLASKRLTDLLVLTSELPSTKPYVASLFDTKKKAETPKMYVTHPGIVATPMAQIPWPFDISMILTLILARWLGSPWMAAVPYKGVVSAAFAALAPPPQLCDLEAREGKGKWGSVVDVFGDERVGRTEVEGWGFCGEVGVVPSGSVTTHRYRGLRQTTRESREQFEEDGRRCWKEMEELRMEWERRLGSGSMSATEKK